MLMIFTAVAVSSSVSAHSTRGLAGAMNVDTPVASVGEIVTFTIDVSQIPSKTRTLEIADSLPAELRLDSSMEPGACPRTGTSWSCTLEGQASLSISLRANVEEAGRGKLLVNRAQIVASGAGGDDGGSGGDDGGEHDVDGGKQYEDGAITVAVEAGVQVDSTTVPTLRSEIAVRLAASQTVATPGGSLNYRIELANGGTGPAQDAVVVARLPKDVTVVSSFPSIAIVTNDGLQWNVDEIPVGSHVYLFNASFAPTGQVTEVLAGAFVTYVDSDGQTPLSRESNLSLQVSVGPPAIPSEPEIPVPWGTIALLLGAAGAGLLLVQRFLLTPHPVGLRVQQLFLLHRSGLLLKHFSLRWPRASDPDILGAMLTVVRTYLEKAVDPSAGPLRQICFGGRDILFAKGAFATLAAVVGKGDSGLFFRKAPRFLANLEAHGGTALANWDGVADRLGDVEGSFRTFTKDLTSRRAS